MKSDASTELLLKLAADIVVACLGRNDVPSAEVPGLIIAVRTALAHDLDEPAARPLQDAPTAVGRGPTLQVAAEATPTPAVPVEESLTDDYIISLEDGGRFRSLRRHLMAKYGMTPDDYRRKWGLRPDYPMVAPNYAKNRSEVAKRIGLGRQPAKSVDGRRRV